MGSLYDIQARKDEFQMESLKDKSSNMDAISNDTEIFDIVSLDLDLDLTSSISSKDNETSQEYQDNNEQGAVDDSTRNHLSILKDDTSNRYNGTHNIQPKSILSKSVAASRRSSRPASVSIDPAV